MKRENPSPLRYPGGKYKISKLIADIIKRAHRIGGVYIEPFAGGAGVALDLLFSDVVRSIVINDSDRAIYSFWRAILTQTEQFIDRLMTVDVSIGEWKRQREIYRRSSRGYSLDLAFAAFFLNRANRSGILSAGPIGGMTQGEWKLDVRFNKADLREKIEKIATYKSRIKVCGKDVFSFIDKVLPRVPDDAFVYFDPPYYKKGRVLYKNFFTPDLHKELRNSIVAKVKCPWIVSYDDVTEIRKLYHNYDARDLSISYSLANNGMGSEVMFFSASDMCVEAGKNKVRME